MEAMIAPARDFRVREACWPVDQSLIRCVREAVFVREQGIPETLEWDGRDAACRHVLAQTPEGTPVGTGRLLPQGRIGRMAVLEDWRGRGVGTALLEALLVLAREAGLAQVEVSAQVAVGDFYARRGFRPVGEPFVEAGIPHRRMVLTLDAVRPGRRR